MLYIKKCTAQSGWVVVFKSADGVESLVDYNLNYPRIRHILNMARSVGNARRHVDSYKKGTATWRMYLKER